MINPKSLPHPHPKKNKNKKNERKWRCLNSWSLKHLIFILWRLCLLQWSDVRMVWTEIEMSAKFMCLCFQVHAIVLRDVPKWIRGICLWLWTVNNLVLGLLITTKKKKTFSSFAPKIYVALEFFFIFHVSL